MNALGLVSVGGGCLALAAGIGLWLGSAEQLPSGRYASSGMVLLENGDDLPASHLIQFSGGRFHAISRQQGLVVEASGDVQVDSGRRYQLRVQQGRVSGLDDDTEDHRLFEALYGSRPGSIIHLQELDGCLLARETSQVYCQLPSGKAP